MSVLRPATKEDKLLIENLYNLYRNDLSDFCDEFRFLDDDGFYSKGISEELLPFGDGVETYIITDYGCPAGLIVVTDERYAFEGCARKIEDLYVIRPARGKGLAVKAAREVTRACPGRWCLSIYKRNRPAKRFWDRFISEEGTLVCAVPDEDDTVCMMFDIKNTENS